MKEEKIKKHSRAKLAHAKGMSVWHEKVIEKIEKILKDNELLWYIPKEDIENLLENLKKGR